jgi:DNA modification methylase
MMIELLHGDCRDVLRTLADNSIDSIVTDPPYELGFMGKSWDASGVAYDVTVWQECLRVLKPGGHLLSFGGSRTYHRMACAIEDAGFQIRDQIMWVYGSGFPKSHNISKGIDKQNGRRFEDRYALGRHIRERRELLGISRATVNSWFGYVDGCEHWERQDTHGARVPTMTDWLLLQDRLGLSNDWHELITRIEAERKIIAQRKAHQWLFNPGQENIFVEKQLDITAPAMAEAKEWDGWGTALKPAHEPIVLARKPLDGTVANNVLTHGVGGLNIDECRVEGIDEANAKRLGKSYGTNHSKTFGQVQAAIVGGNLNGRFPANFIHDGSDEVLELFPETKGGTWNTTKGARHFNNDGEPTGYATSKADSSVGSAARFFYCAKASKKDRNEGLDHLPEVMITGRDVGQDAMAVPHKTRSNLSANYHPTVKPTELMRYLCRLITPPNGTVLDPFTGSGSTGKAAVLEGFNFIGVEQSAEYIEIAKARIEAAR